MMYQIACRCSPATSRGGRGPAARFSEGVRVSRISGVISCISLLCVVGVPRMALLAPGQEADRLAPRIRLLEKAPTPAGVPYSVRELGRIPGAKRLALSEAGGFQQRWVRGCLVAGPGFRHGAVVVHDREHGGRGRHYAQRDVGAEHGELVVHRGATLRMPAC